MPWILVDLSANDDITPSQPTAQAIAESAAEALELAPEDVLVQLRKAAASWGTSAVVTVVGRDRGLAGESSLRESLVAAVAEHTATPADHVVIVRQH